MNAQVLIWSVIAAIAAVDVVMLPAQGMTIASRWPAFGLVVLMCSLSALVQRRNPAAARLAGAVAQIWALSDAGAILSYTAMAATPFAMADASLARWDAALGFDWIGWYAWVHAHPSVHFVLAAAYGSAPIQVVLLVLYFSYVDAKRVDELLLSGLLPIGIITPIMMLLPAVGAWSQHGVGTEPWRADILALRDHSLAVIGQTQGIISFPSYHTVLGVVLAYAARGRTWFIPSLCLNLLLIAAVMTEGAHYGVDLLSGLAVAVASIAATRWMLARAGRARPFRLPIALPARL
nr:phosphatase PAP2 family protein [uncultured Rhodopila sp.]